MVPLESKSLHHVSTLLAVLSLAVALGARATPAFAAESGSSCSQAVSLSAGHDVAHPGLPAGDTLCYRLEVPPRSGFLVVAARASAPDQEDASLLLRGRPRAGTAASLEDPAAIVEFDRSASHLTLWIDEGTDAVVVELTAPGPAREIGEHVLSSRFLAAADLVAMIEPGHGTPLAAKDGEDGEIDPILVVGNPGDPFDFGPLAAGVYTVLVMDHGADQGSYSLVFSSLSW